MASQKEKVKNFSKKISETYYKVKKMANSEFEETKALFKILFYAVKSYSKEKDFNLDEEDIKFIKGQSKDVVKNLLIVTLALIPVPIPLSTFLVVFGKKVGIDFIPKKHNIPEKIKK